MNARGEEAATGHPDSGLAMVASHHPAVGLAVGVFRGSITKDVHRDRGPAPLPTGQDGGGPSGEGLF